MKLTWKAFVVIFISISSLLLLVYFIINPQMMRQYEELEERMLYTDINRVESAIVRRLQDLSSFTRDWGVWDDSYTFLNGENEHYIQSNWTQNTFENNVIDFVYYLDREGDIFFHDYDREAEGVSLLNHLDIGKHFDNFITLSRAHYGVVLVNDRAMMVASHPIYDSYMSEEPNGILIGGRLLNDELLGIISQDVGLTIEWSAETDDTGVVRNVVRVDGDTIRGMYAFPYTNTGTLGQLSFEETRDFYLQAQTNQRWRLFAYGILTICFALLTLFWLDRLILSRMKRISGEIQHIESSRDVTKRVSAEGNDEITDVEEGINRMLIALSDKQQEIKMMAEQDRLTGYLNRHAFTVKVNDYLKNNRHEKVYLLFLDIDLFKRINDTFGHHAGDKVLRQITTRISECVGEGAIIGRWGGDELVLLISQCKDEELNAFIQKLLLAIAQPLKVNKMKFNVTSSIGVSVYPDDGQSAEELIQLADIAMYEAKRRGKNRYYYYDEVQNKEFYNHYVVLESDLQKALGNGELEVYYQPIINSDAGEVSSLEALLRWNHPDRGLILPNHFIPIAEENGMMQKIGEWVLEQGVKDVKEWHEAGYSDLSLSINVSKTQLMDRSLIEKVKEVINEGYPPHLLEMEITESDVTAYVEKVQDFANELKQLHVRVSLDDFGTGVSSMKYLKDIKVDRLKIDRHFLKSIPTDTFDKALLSGMFKLCENLKIEVVTEGIETTEQYEYLYNLYRPRMQGFLFSPPVKKEQISKMLENGILDKE
ncbi:EAL domain-containing protein [Bacillus shivajii]|uniref:bifunctional diguanylate cyclase/phosphodiesterase n=1 Tax=Bacillus shivajii TaxID=1983719 RepID=UPI001CFB425C|nr:EAL domain-containing protein [Bacillus shivajii]UCZ53627.1 EAL domain-containing protein [Bacillus shivajii]